MAAKLLSEIIAEYEKDPKKAALLEQARKDLAVIYGNIEKAVMIKIGKLTYFNWHLRCDCKTRSGGEYKHLFWKMYWRTN